MEEFDSIENINFFLWCYGFEFRGSELMMII